MSRARRYLVSRRRRAPLLFDNEEVQFKSADQRSRRYSVFVYRV